MHAYTEPTKAVLREIIAQDGEATIDHLEEFVDARARAVVANLQAHKLIDSVKQHHARTYHATVKGARIASTFDKPMGNMPAPKSRISTGCYVGGPPSFVRDGAMHAYDLPSVSNGKQIERVRPLIMSSSVQGR